MSIGDLKSRLQARISEDRETLEQIACDEFESLRRSLSESSKSALATIETDIAAQTAAMSETVSSQLERLEEQTRRLQWALVSSWLKSAALGICLMVGLTLGVWGLSAATSSYIQRLRSQIVALQHRKEDLQETMALLNRKTWGVQLVETEQGRFIVLPRRSKARIGWTLDDRDAIKLER